MAIKQHKLRTTLITLLAVIVILFAVFFSLFRAAIPYITNYGEDIEAELSRQLGMSVEIGMVDADIAWLVPRLKLLDVNLYDSKANRFFLHFEEINLSLNWRESLQIFKPALGSISLVGLNLNLERDAKGQYSIQGFKIGNNESNSNGFTIPDKLIPILEHSSVYIVDSVLHWTDKLNNNQQLIFDELNITLINKSPRHQLSINMSMPNAYGERAELVLDITGPVTEPLSWDGSVFISVKKLKLEKWFDDYWQYIDFKGSGKINADVWLEWKEQKITEINTELNANELVLHYLDADVRSWKLDGIVGKAKWKQFVDRWHLDVRDLAIFHDKGAWPVSSSIEVEMDEKKNSINFKSNFLRIQDLMHLAGLGLRIIPQSHSNWNEKISSYQPYGDLYNISAETLLDSWDDAKINVRFVDFSYKSDSSAPSVNGLDGQLIYDNKQAILQLDSQNVALDFDDLFRDEIILTSVKGDVEISKQLSGWEILSRNILINTPHINSLNHFEIRLPDKRPASMNLVSNFNNGNFTRRELYLPTKIMSDELVNWLDDALVAMEIQKGGVIYHGAFQDFPFNNNKGVFEVLLDIENATLKYQPDWPALNNMQAQIRFYKQSMEINNSTGSVFDMRFNNTEIHINDFDNTHVKVKGDIQGELFDVMKFIKQSPLQEILGTHITDFGVEGNVGLKLNLEIPISKDDPTQVSGLLSFNKNNIFLPKEKYQFKNFMGQLKFTEKGVWAEKLSATLDGDPFDMSLATISKNNESVTHISAKGYLAVKNLLSPVDFVKPYMQGKTDWEIDMYFPESSNNKLPIDIFVHSNLKGIRSIVPGPFSKSVDEQAPFKLHLGVYPDELKAYIKYSEDFKLAANLKNGKWDANIDASSLKGKAVFMADLALDEVANIDLDYINISKFKSAKDAPGSGLQASDIPSLNFFSKKLEWKGKTFTNVDIQTQRIKPAMKITYFELHAPDTSVIGKGLWDSGWIYKNKTSLDFRLETTNLGLALEQLKISKSIEGTKGDIEFKWRWKAEPYNFDWDILQGNSHLELSSGSFVDIDAGAGRLLGILNFETIFSLDFRKQVEDGFSFDELEANFIFNDGHAVTDDLAIESKVANINMRGRVGVANKDYDLKVEVFPKVSNAFTVIGVATGGPILGLGVHFFQKIFGIDKVAGSKSTVTGSWEKPIITEINKKTDNEDNTSNGAADDDAF